MKSAVFYYYSSMGMAKKCQLERCVEISSNLRVGSSERFLWYRCNSQVSVCVMCPPLPSVLNSHWI